MHILTCVSVCVCASNYVYVRVNGCVKHLESICVCVHACDCLCLCVKATGRSLCASLCVCVSMSEKSKSVKTSKIFE